MEQLYLGRIVAAARTRSGRMVALYRVSSRSFPNRQAVIAPDGKSVAIIPKEGFEADIRKNPYIAYNCARLVGKTAVLANGSHADPVAEKIAMGLPVRDAFALSLLAMDYEKDDYSTPRICSAVEAGSGTGWLGVVRKDGIDVRSFALEPGQVVHLSTYAHDVPSKHHLSAFDAEDAVSACRFLFAGGVFAGFTNGVTAVAAMESRDGFELAVLDA